jgi:hypothetical protein
MPTIRAIDKKFEVLELQLKILAILLMFAKKLLKEKISKVDFCPLGYNAV